MRYDRKKDIPPKYLLLVFTVICIVFLFLSYAAKDHVAALKLYTSKAIAPFQKGVNEIGLWTDSKMKNIKKIEELNEENRALREEKVLTREEQAVMYTPVRLNSGEDYVDEDGVLHVKVDGNEIATESGCGSLSEQGLNAVVMNLLEEYGYL